MKRTFGSRSDIFCDIILRKSLKSMAPVPSVSTPEIICLSSSFFGSNPSALIATCNIVILPVIKEINYPFFSNFEKKFIFLFRKLNFRTSWLTTNLNFFDVDCASSFRVEQVEGFSDFRFLLVLELQLRRFLLCWLFTISTHSRQAKK